MNRLFVFFIIIALSAMTSCAEKTLQRTGFLSTYARLGSTPEGNLRYINRDRLGSYSKFIIEPVVFRLYNVPVGKRPDTRTRTELSNYMHQAIVKAIQERYTVVSQPAPQVARVRVAITDIDKSVSSLNVLPASKLSGIGLGGVSMEAEVVDTITGEQIGAVIQSKKGKRVSAAGLNEWGDAQAVMDEWAQRFRKLLDETH
ncbi:MAG: DUF3313 domain-containing protein [Nitrospiraceae bacterium]|nr:MAG: DUF3313 domain-containing protein [Nitrospiraceae bacterium]